MNAKSRCSILQNYLLTAFADHCQERNLEKISMSRATSAYFNNTNARMGEQQKANEDGKAIISNEREDPEGVLAESKRFGTDKRFTPRTRAARENISVHEPHDFEDVDVYHKICRRRSRAKC